MAQVHTNAGAHALKFFWRKAQEEFLKAMQTAEGRAAFFTGVLEAAQEEIDEEDERGGVTP